MDLEEERETQPSLKKRTALKYFTNTLSIVQFVDWGFQQQPEYKQIIKIMFLELIVRLKFSVLHSTSILTQ